MDYRAYLLDEHGHIIDVRVFTAIDDQAAMSHAQRYADGHDIEIWNRSRRVALISRQPKSFELDVK